MTLTELDEHVLAYFLVTEAFDVSIDGRFFPREQFVRVFKDRIMFPAYRFGDAAANRAEHVAAYLVDELIEKKAMLTVNDEFTGISHQFDNDLYRSYIRGLIQSNALCQRAKDAGPQFWETAFAAVSR